MKRFRILIRYYVPVPIFRQKMLHIQSWNSSSVIPINRFRLKISLFGKIKNSKTKYYNLGKEIGSKYAKSKECKPVKRDFNLENQIPSSRRLHYMVVT